ncbi:MAG TPA: 23S rRNA (guanosine(2251)-2'-O)-methyltransferase RlmB [Candidatus Polarisedimenticolia bacterium]
MSSRISGIHPVLEALRAGRRELRRVLLSNARHDRKLDEIEAAAREARVPVQRVPAAALDRLATGKTHQGVIAEVGEAAFADPEEVLARAGKPPLLLVLDGIEDPRNLGAVIRSAAAAGADGLFIPSHGAAGLTDVCAKASAGAVERLPVARIGNVVAFLKSLKERGIWVAGLDAKGTTPWTGFDLRVPLALVLGGEGRGLRRLARETCDVLLSIPLRSEVESLNLSVAAGVALFEAVRQRTRTGAGEGRGGAGVHPESGE